jgi:hypothetical protein
VLSILIGLVIVIGVKTYESPVQRKLKGFWNIEFENSYIERDSIYELSWSPMCIEKKTIKLPMLLGNPMGTFFEDQKDAMGTWQVISTNPDSVFFNVPKNPLHGKYAIRFFIDESGYSGMNNIYKIELENDSTYLICNKGGVFYDRSVRDWVGK